MHNPTIDQAHVAEYEKERAVILARYTPRLKALSISDPQYGEVWSARADALRKLAEQYAMPAEVAV